MEITDQEKQSIKAVLEAALHNATMVQDQLASLYDPKDKSFTDFDMRPVVNEMNQAVQAIRDSIKELERL